MANVLCYAQSVGSKVIDLPAEVPDRALTYAEAKFHVVPYAKLLPTCRRAVNPNTAPPSETRRRTAPPDLPFSSRPFTHIVSDNGTPELVEEHEAEAFAKAGAGFSVTPLAFGIRHYDHCRAYEDDGAYLGLPGKGSMSITIPTYETPVALIDCQAMSTMGMDVDDGEEDRAGDDGETPQFVLDAVREVNPNTVSMTFFGQRLEHTGTGLWNWLPAVHLPALKFLHLCRATIDAAARDAIESMHNLETLIIHECAMADLCPPGLRAGGGSPGVTKLRHLSITLDLLRMNPRLQELEYETLCVFMTSTVGNDNVPVNLRLRAGGPGLLSLVYPPSIYWEHRFPMPAAKGVRDLHVAGSPDGALPSHLSSLRRLRLEAMSDEAIRRACAAPIDVGTLEITGRVQWWPDGGDVRMEPRELVLIDPSQRPPYAPFGKAKISGFDH